MLLRDSVDSSGRHGQSLLGNPVCQRAFRKLLGIGSGRFTRLKKSVAAGMEMAPLDGRRIERTKRHNTPKNVSKRAIVYDFLEELRNSISEPLPEANQSRQDAAGGKKGLMSFRRHRGRRPRSAAASSRGGDRSSMRLLPPGTFSDYLRVLQSRHPNTKFSLKLFNKVPHTHTIDIFIFIFSDLDIYMFTFMYLRCIGTGNSYLHIHIYNTIYIS